MADKNDNQNIDIKNKFKISGSEKANQVGPSSPSDRTTDHPQAEAYASSADNDMDRLATSEGNLQNDPNEAQDDGNLSFPEGK